MGVRPHDDSTGSVNLPGLPPPKPIPLKERAALVFVERAKVDVLDGAFVAIDADGVRTHIPIGGIACLMLEPGARISHAAVALAARAGTLVTWIGEAGVRLYSAGQPGGARSDRLLWQAQLALDPSARLRVVRKMYLIPYYVHPSRAPEGVGLWIFGGWREAGRQGGEALGTRCTGSQWYRSQPGPPGSPRMVPGECRRPVPRAAGLSNARWIGLAGAAAVRRRSTAGSDAATAASWPPPSAACAAAPPARSGD